MRFLKLLGLGALFLCSSAMAATDASSLKLQVFSVMLSTSPLCTNPVTVFSNSTPTEVDFMAAPTLGGGNPPDGTYPCVIIKMLDGIKFKPSANSGSCTANQEYTDSVCQASEFTNAPDSSLPQNCTSGSTDVVYLYITTDKTVPGGGHAFQQPTSSSAHAYGVPLATPLVIAGTTRSKFVVKATNSVDGSNPTCGMNAPTFDFQRLP